jgi:hypothetical protein
LIVAVKVDVEMPSAGIEVKEATKLDTLAGSSGTVKVTVAVVATPLLLAMALIVAGPVAESTEVKTIFATPLASVVLDVDCK